MKVTGMVSREKLLHNAYCVSVEKQTTNQEYSLLDFSGTSTCITSNLTDNLTVMTALGRDFE